MSEEKAFGLCLRFVLDGRFRCLLCAFDNVEGSLRRLSWLIVSGSSGARTNVCVKVEVVTVVSGIKLHTGFCSGCYKY